MLRKSKQQDMKMKEAENLKNKNIEEPFDSYFGDWRC